jgi:hypothetical protein
MAGPHLIAVEAFLHRVFPTGLSAEVAGDFMSRRLFRPRRDCDDFSFCRDRVGAEERSEDRNWRMQLQGWTMFHPLLNTFDTSVYKVRIAASFST